MLYTIEIKAMYKRGSFSMHIFFNKLFCCVAHLNLPDEGPPEPVSLTCPGETPSCCPSCDSAATPWTCCTIWRPSRHTTPLTP